MSDKRSQPRVNVRFTRDNVAAHIRELIFHLRELQRSGDADILPEENGIFERKFRMYDPLIARSDAIKAAAQIEAYEHLLAHWGIRP